MLFFRFQFKRTFIAAITANLKVEYKVIIKVNIAMTVIENSNFDSKFKVTHFTLTNQLVKENISFNSIDMVVRIISIIIKDAIKIIDCLYCNNFIAVHD